MQEISTFLNSTISLAIGLFYIATMWRIFSKAGKPGWLALVPIVNVIMLISIAGKEWWWALLLLIPFVNILVFFLILHGVSENFGHGVGFTLGLFFLGFLFFPVLAWGDDKYYPVYH